MGAAPPTAVVSDATSDRIRFIANGEPIGELGAAGVDAAVAAAVDNDDDDDDDAVGVRVRELPITPRRLLEALASG